MACRAGMEVKKKMKMSIMKTRMKMSMNMKAAGNIKCRDVRAVVLAACPANRYAA
jgi:hypothetical protein